MKEIIEWLYLLDGIFNIIVVDKFVYWIGFCLYRNIYGCLKYVF